MFGWFLLLRCILLCSALLSLLRCLLLLEEGFGLTLLLGSRFFFLLFVLFFSFSALPLFFLLSSPTMEELLRFLDEFIIGWCCRSLFNDSALRRPHCTRPISAVDAPKLLQTTQQHAGRGVPTQNNNNNKKKWKVFGFVCRIITSHVVVQPINGSTDHHGSWFAYYSYILGVIE